MWTVNIPFVKMLIYFANLNIVKMYLIGQMAAILKLIIAYHLIWKEKWLVKEEKIREAMEILNANWKAEDGSFLYYLYEENNFHESAFLELCSCISSLLWLHAQDQTVSAKILFIYEQVLKPFLYSFSWRGRHQIRGKISF